MLATSVLMMFWGAGRVLYIRILAALSKMAKLGLLSSLIKPHLNDESGIPVVRATGIRRHLTSKSVEVESNNTLNHSERTVI